MNRGPIWVRLTQTEIAIADRIGLKRQEAADRKGRKGHNGAPATGLASLRMNQFGARCELAGKLYCDPVRWNDYAEDIDDLADLEDWIDVKGRQEAWHDLPVQRNGNPDWAYLLILADQHPLYEIVGWCWGHEAQQKRYWADPAGGRPAYFVKRNEKIIKQPWDLLFEIKKRQEYNR